MLTGDRSSNDRNEGFLRGFGLLTRAMGGHHQNDREEDRDAGMVCKQKRGKLQILCMKKNILCK